MLPPFLSFSASPIRGSGRGKALGAPTINVDLNDVPASLKEGIYACRAILGHQTLDAVLHYGPRPVFQDIPSCEIHVLDAVVADVPPQVNIDIVGRLRDVRDFPDAAALMTQIEQDIADARAMLHA